MKKVLLPIFFALFFPTLSIAESSDFPFQSGEEIKAPVLEFRKINPTKYRVRVHGATEKFPLVFSETFHEGWRVYPVEMDGTVKNKDEILKQVQDDRYIILDNNEGDQATKEELAEYVQKGWASFLDEKNIAFVSKNFNGTIQNDNLPKGMIWETWFKNSLDEKNHLKVNGYANSWVVDPEEICAGFLCRKNADGSYDFELAVEYWPQRLFYFGAGISFLTLLICLGYFLLRTINHKP